MDRSYINLSFLQLHHLQNPTLNRPKSRVEVPTELFFLYVLRDLESKGEERGHREYAVTESMLAHEAEAWRTIRKRIPVVSVDQVKTHPTAASDSRTEWVNSRSAASSEAKAVLSD